MHTFNPRKKKKEKIAAHASESIIALDIGSDGRLVWLVATTCDELLFLFCSLNIQIDFYFALSRNIKGSRYACEL